MTKSGGKRTKQTRNSRASRVAVESINGCNRVGRIDRPVDANLTAARNAVVSDGGFPLRAINSQTLLFKIIRQLLFGTSLGKACLQTASYQRRALFIVRPCHADEQRLVRKR